MLVCKMLYTNSIRLVLFVVLCVVNAHFALGQSVAPNNTTINVPNDTIITTRTLVVSDSILNADTLKNTKPERLDAPIKYTSNDSIIFTGKGVAYMFGATDINYQTINLKADFVRIKMDSSLLFARGSVDENGARVGQPIFSENDKSYESRELNYNLKTKKGFIRQAVTEEGEGYILSSRTKKSDDEVLCIADAKYTTCDCHDHPHFYLSLSKAKVKPGSFIVTGPAHLVIADIPLPIAIPFGFFPFTSDYSSGVLMPSYADELNRGFGLTNGGYYFAINDYVDLEARGDIYTKGTWALRLNSNYLKKYKFRGSFSAEYRNDVTGEKDLPNFNESKNFSLRWSHSQDQKASPNFSFSSSVNFTTSGFNRSNINNYSRPDINSQSNTSSTVNMTKRFPNIPQLNLSVTMSINQRAKDSTLSVNFPSLNIGYSQFYPFKRKVVVGSERWYEKIRMSYTGTLANSIDNVKESEFFQKSLTRDWRNGMRHSIPVSASFNLFKYINISPSFNYTERWTLKSFDREWNYDEQKLKIDTISGFRRVYDFSMSVSTSTKLYGNFTPSRKLFGDKIEVIRHVATPSLSFNYTPDFGDKRWGYWDSYIRSVPDAINPNINNETEVFYSHYEGTLYGGPGRGKNGSVSFNLQNNVEMKVRNDNDTTGTERFKKISLIDNLSFGTSYNLAADSFNLSNISVALRLKLSKSYTLSLNTSFDPYMIGTTSAGRLVKINQLRWNNGYFPRFMGTSTSQSFNINNGTFKKWFGKKEKENSTQPTAAGENGDDGDEGQKVDGSSESAPALAIGDYAKFEPEWNMSFTYTLTVGPDLTQFVPERNDYKLMLTHNFSMSGNLKLTPNWNFSFNPTYDATAKKFTYLGINVSRSLHCWTMTGSIVPIGFYKSYSFRIGVNASMLQDLKYEKQSEPRANNINWF